MNSSGGMHTLYHVRLILIMVCQHTWHNSFVLHRGISGESGNVHTREPNSK